MGSALGSRPLIGTMQGAKGWEVSFYKWYSTGRCRLSPDQVGILCYWLPLKKSHREPRMECAERCHSKQVASFYQARENLNVCIVKK